MTKAHAPTELIADYAAGALSPGMQLLVGSHLGYCPECSHKAARLEAIGGALLADCAPVAPTSNCLAKVLARIAGCSAAEADATDCNARLPPLLRRRLPGPVGTLPWRSLLPGLSECRLDGFAAEAVGLMQGRPGTRMLAPGHRGRESRLVLSGSIRDGGRTFGRGDLALPDLRGGCCPEVVGREPCLCLVVQPDPDGAPGLERPGSP